MQAAAKNVFLVDDDSEDQEFFIEALEEIENATLYDVANNGKEALEKLEKSDVPPSHIFLDLNMPVMTGIECLAEIVRNPKTRNVPVVILSTDTGQIKLARKLGAKAFIKKTGNNITLRRQVEQMINLDFSTDSHVANQTFQTALTAF